jgi:F-type H+-transporting ATPase subunit delta
MSDGSTARRWAKALDELAVESGRPEAVLADLSSVASVLVGEGEALRHALSSPLFAAEERRAVLDAVLAKLGVAGTVASFLRLLADRGRFGSLPAIVAEATKLADLRAGRVRIQVTTVDALSPELEAELAAAFGRVTGKTVVLEPKVDPSLLGGLVARVGSRVYDASLKSRLTDLTNRLLHAQGLPEA